MITRKDKRADDITRPLKQPKFESVNDGFPAKPMPENPIALLDAVAAISTPLEAYRVAQVVAQQIVLFSTADVCTISRWDAEENLITLWAEFYRGADHASSIAHVPYSPSDYPKTEAVLLTGLPVKLRINDPTLPEDERLLMKSMRANSLLMLPLVSQEKVIGLIEVFESDTDQDFSSDEVANIQVLAKHAGISLERARLLEETKKSAVELEIIRRASIKLTASLDQTQVFNAILHSALQLSPDALDAHIFTVEDGEIKFGGSLWANGKEGPSYQTVREGGLTDNVARTGETIAIEKVEEHRFYIDSRWVKDGWKGSIIGLPLKTGNKVVGVMNIAYRTRQDFSESRLRLLGLLSDQGAIAIHNARLHNFVKHQAVTDSLTGTANRRAFNDRLEEELRRSKRYQRPFSLLILDLDGFKAVNDTYGHMVGDQTLQAVAECLQAEVRDTDFLARYGGDEFALILPETNCDQATTIVEKINAALKERKFDWLTESPTKTITISTGIACYPGDADNADGLISKADSELYLKKGNAR